MYYDRINNRTEDEKIYPVIDFKVEKFEHQKRGKRLKKKRLTDYYVVVVDNGHTKYYVGKLTARKLLGTYYANSAKQFTTEQEAQKKVQIF